jgi:nitrate reductase NapAB chaperone NapD
MDHHCKVIALVLDNRSEDAPEVQKVLTAHGCLFRARLGLPGGPACSNQGLIVLVVEGTAEELAAFLTDLARFPQVKVHQAAVC